MTADHITDRAAWRDAWEDDLERTRIVHRVGAALSSGKDAAARLRTTPSPAPTRRTP